MGNYLNVFYIINDPDSYLIPIRFRPPLPHLIRRHIPDFLRYWIETQRMEKILIELGKTTEDPELFDFFYVSQTPTHFIANHFEKFWPCKKPYLDFGDLISKELKTPVRVWIYDDDLAYCESVKSFIRKTYHRPDLDMDRIVSAELDTSLGGGCRDSEE